MHVTFEHDGLKTTAHVESEFHGFTGDGAARCRQEDHYVQGLGERIAAGRALQDLGKKMEEAYLASSITQAQWEAQDVEGTDGARAESVRTTMIEALSEIKDTAEKPFAVSL